MPIVWCIKNIQEPRNLVSEMTAVNEKLRSKDEQNLFYIERQEEAFRRLSIWFKEKLLSLTHSEVWNFYFHKVHIFFQETWQKIG